MSSAHPPGRVFLDTNVLHLVHDYGEFVFENVPPEPDCRIHRVPGGLEELDALRMLFQICQRGVGPELALSRGSLEEVDDRRNAQFSSWAWEVHAAWEERLASRDVMFEDDGTAAGRRNLVQKRSIGFVSEKDRVLLGDALDLGCEYFLTIDGLNKGGLLGVRDKLQERLGIRVLRPTEFWEVFRPFAALFW